MAKEVNLLVQWHDEPTRARGRESVVAAVVLHLSLVVLILLSPSVLAQPEQTVQLVPVERQDLTMLTLPPDLKPKSDQGELTPEERKRIAREKSLTLDPRQLEFLAPPQPDRPGQPAIAPPGGEPDATGRDRSRGEEPGAREGRPGGEQTDEPVEFARLEDVPPRPTDDSGLKLPGETLPGEVIREGVRRGQGGGSSVPPGELGGVNPNFNTPFPTILSDTRGVDFGPYLIRLLRKVRSNWYALIPESARWGEQGRVVIIFSIMGDGSVPAGQPTVVRSSQRSHLDRPAMAAIRASQPFPPLPEEFTGEHIVLQFTFLYNLPLNYEGPL